MCTCTWIYNACVYEYGRKYMCTHTCLYLMMYVNEIVHGFTCVCSGEVYLTRNMRKDQDFINGMRCEVEAYDSTAQAINMSMAYVKMSTVGTCIMTAYAVRSTLTQ